MCQLEIICAQFLTNYVIKDTLILLFRQRLGITLLLDRRDGHWSEVLRANIRHARIPVVIAAEGVVEMWRFVNFIHCSLSNALVVPLLHWLRAILNRKLRRHHGRLLIVVLVEHRLVLLIVLFLRLILLLHVDFKMLAVVEELAVVIIVRAITLAHILSRIVVLASSDLVAHLVCILTVLGLVCITRHVFSFLESLRRVIVFLSSTNGVFDCG